MLVISIGRANTTQYSSSYHQPLHLSSHPPGRVWEYCKDGWFSSWSAWSSHITVHYLIPLQILRRSKTSFYVGWVHSWLVTTQSELGMQNMKPVHRASVITTRNDWALTCPGQHNCQTSPVFSSINVSIVLVQCSLHRAGPGHCQGHLTDGSLSTASHHGG